MIELKFPDEQARILPMYLATEEYAARIAGDDDIFMMWRVAPSVIVGRHQVMQAEVNLPFCREHNIAVWRRKSGGGCVFSDPNNIMMSYITRSDDVTGTFARYTGAVAAMLRGLGLNATDNARNDVLIDGRKVSGNAFYHLPSGMSIVHGTMLFDTDFALMRGALTPSHAKIASKGVTSVASRVTTLREHLDMSIEAFMAYVRATLCSGERVLTAEEVSEIEREILPTYLDEAFLRGKEPACTLTRQARIEGAGEITANINTNRGVIAGITLSGDFFTLQPVETLTNRLIGKPLETSALRQALGGIDTRNFILNLTTDKFINLLTT